MYEENIEELKKLLKECLFSDFSFDDISFTYLDRAKGITNNSLEYQEFIQKHEKMINIINMLYNKFSSEEDLQKAYLEVKDITLEQRENNTLELNEIKKSLIEIAKSSYNNYFDNSKSIISKAQMSKIADSFGNEHNIPVYVLENNEPFDFLITIMHESGRGPSDVNMYGRPAHKLTIDDPSAFCKDLRGGSDIISTSLITDRHIDTYIGYKPNIIYAFNDISNDDLLSMCPSDGAFSPDIEDIKENGLFKNNDPVGTHMFMLQTERSLDKYNEIAITRKTSDGQKRLPKAVICYNEVNDDSIKHAQYFNIPIIIIDTKTYDYLKWLNNEKLR